MEILLVRPRRLEDYLLFGDEEVLLRSLSFAA